MLSNRELQVASLVARECTNDQIAVVLFLSSMTVRQHMTKIIKKLGVKSRVGVALWYYQNYVESKGKVA